MRIGPYAIGRRLETAAQEHAALEIGHCAFLLRPLRDRQHDVGARGSFGQKQVRDDQQIEVVLRAAGGFMPVVGAGRVTAGSFEAVCESLRPNDSATRTSTTAARLKALTPMKPLTVSAMITPTTAPAVRWTAPETDSAMVS